MAVRRRSASPRRTFNANSTGGVRVKARSRRNGRRKIVAKSFREFLKVKHSARRLEFSFGIKMRDRRITLRQKKNSGRRTPTSLTKRNTEFGIGRAGGALRRGKPSGASRPLWSREKFCGRFIRRSTSSLTSHKS